MDGVTTNQSLITVEVKEILRESLFKGRITRKPFWEFGNGPFQVNGERVR